MASETPPPVTTTSSTISRRAPPSRLSATSEASNEERRPPARCRPRARRVVAVRPSSTPAAARIMAPVHTDASCPAATPQERKELRILEASGHPGPPHTTIRSQAGAFRKAARRLDHEPARELHGSRLLGDDHVLDAGNDPLRHRQHTDGAAEVDRFDTIVKHDAKSRRRFPTSHRELLLGLAGNSQGRSHRLCPFQWHAACFQNTNNDNCAIVILKSSAWRIPLNSIEKALP